MMFTMFQSQGKNLPFLLEHITSQLEGIMYLLGKHKREHSLKRLQAQQRVDTHLFLAIKAPE
nr:MAG TPA: hypothetical protein [Caudoviricetes sp.]